MSVWFVSRHPGAIEWMKRQKQWSVEHWVTHLDVASISHGDVVIGTLPVHLAAAVCAKGAQFYFLQLSQLESQRGKEYTSEEMELIGCSLMPFYVRAL